MKRLLAFLRSLFKRKSVFDELDYGKPATVEDELSRLNNER